MYPSAKRKRTTAAVHRNKTPMTSSDMPLLSIPEHPIECSSEAGTLSPRPPDMTSSSSASVEEPMSATMKPFSETRDLTLEEKTQVDLAMLIASGTKQEKEYALGDLESEIRDGLKQSYSLASSELYSAASEVMSKVEDCALMMKMVLESIHSERAPASKEI